MNLNIPKFALNFVILIVLQTVLLDSLSLNRFLDPKVYAIAFLSFPVFFPKHLLLLVAFVVGLVMDVLTGTMGVHTSACLASAFIRPYILNFLKPKEGYNNLDEPDLKSHGLSWYIGYLTWTIIPFHLFLFYFEAFSLANFFGTFWRALICGLMAIFLIVIVRVILQPKALKNDQF
jgi:rod shape-determining protein MreD